jgi:hypothetical protein
MQQDRLALESGHHLADLCTFSSCKGLFGLNRCSSLLLIQLKPKNKVTLFLYLDINTHINKRLTGPYHTIGSLYYVLKKHSKFKKAVKKNKKNF